MKAAVRHALWFTAFAAIVLAPLAAAGIQDRVGAVRAFDVELGVALGFVGFSLLGLQFALVTRLPQASARLGSDALMLFHRKMGIAALAFVAGHVLLLIRSGFGPGLLNPFASELARSSGAIAFWSTLLLVVTSVARRRLFRRYERWRALHALGALIVAATMLLHALASGGYATAPLVRGVLIAQVALAVLLAVRFRVIRPLLSWRRPWELVELADRGGDTCALVLRAIGHAGLRFDAGQFVWITTGATPFSAEEHPMSIASAARPGPSDTVELAIKALGDWSGTIVPRLAPGTRVWIEGPFGTFTLGGAGPRPLVLIAGGIGITPMRSILLTLRERGDRRPVHLVYAARNRERAVFADELDGLRAELDLTIVFVFEQPDPEWQGERGHVTAQLLRRHVPPPLAEREWFVCGPGPMMDALERALLELGIPAARVRTERFDMV